MAGLGNVDQDHHAEKPDKFYADTTWQQQGWAEQTVP